MLTGASLDDRHDALSNLRTVLLIGGPVALLLASLAGYLVAFGALRPVEAMRRRAAEISAAEPGERLPLPEARDELRRLGETLNGMLGRLEAALERERTFVDDASHELRTPLALHKTELELALRYAKTPEEMRAAIASAIVEVDRLSALAEDLLVLARSQEGKLALHLRRVRVADLLGDVRERFAMRLGESGRSLTVEPADGLMVDADPVRLEQALTNLIENAIEHGAGEITVEHDGVRWRARDPRVRSWPGVPSGIPGPRLRAVQSRRSGPRGRRHGARARDRGGDRTRTSRQCARGQPQRGGRRRVGRIAPLSLSRSIHPLSVETVAQ